MSPVEELMGELEAALRVRGRSRRRILAECRDHLAESSATVGQALAVRSFGSAAALAAEFDLQVAFRRSGLAAVASLVGVVGVGVSALEMLAGVDAHQAAPMGWRIAFFACAQVAAVAMLLALLRAAVVRRGDATAGDVVVVCRRAGVALGFAALTMFSVGAALPGQTSVWKIVVGPALALVAGGGVARTHRLVRALEQQPSRVHPAPLADLASLGRSYGVRKVAWLARPRAGLVLTSLVAVAAAFSWDVLDHGTVPDAAAAAVIEVLLMLAGYVLLGVSLGLRTSIGQHRRALPAR